MEWLTQYFTLEVLLFVLPIAFVLIVLCLAIVKSNKKQKERLAKLNQGFHLEGENLK